MPTGLVRLHDTGNLHFITFSCHGRRPYLQTPETRSLVENAIERARISYHFWITGYVVMPNHVHILISEPERKTIADVIKAIKLSVALRQTQRPFWEQRYYDFNVFTEEKRIEKLRYMHRNPVGRYSIQRPEDWAWSSFDHYATGSVRCVEVESPWTALRRHRAAETRSVAANCDNKEIVLTPRRLAPLVFVAILFTLGCHAQSPIASRVVAGSPLPPSVSHRIEVLLRQKAQLPPESTVDIGPAQPSDVPGYSTVAVTFSNEGKTSHPVNFLVSADGKTVAQFSKYDISADPRTLVSADGRPSRGGPPSAPVVIVNFDDLECPFCARFHESLFPAIAQRYGDKVRIVYKDFPLTQIHPWAMRAAVDVECLAVQSPSGYWNLVDYIHAHASDIGSDPSAKITGGAKSDKPEHTLDRANAQLDKLTREQGAFQKVDAAKLDACITKQDTSAIDASTKVGDALNLDSTPTFFINGAKFDGAVSIGFIFDRIDEALRAENIAPPPPYVAPAEPVPATTDKPAPATKPAPTK